THHCVWRLTGECSAKTVHPSSCNAIYFGHYITLAYAWSCFVECRLVRSSSDLAGLLHQPDFGFRFNHTTTVNQQMGVTKFRIWKIGPKNLVPSRSIVIVIHLYADVLSIPPAPLSLFRNEIHWMEFTTNEFLRVK